MKESIDLTEHRDFRDNGQKSPVRYPHKKVPWKSAGDYELAEIVSDSGYISFRGSDDSFTINNITWNSFFRLAHEDEDIHNSIDSLSLWTRENQNFSNTTSISRRASWKWSDSSSVYVTYNESDMYLDFSEQHGYTDFPTGKRDFIKSHRRLQPITPVRKYYKKQCYCEICKNKIPRTPWNDSSSVWKPLCEKCKEDEARKLKDRKNWLSSKLGFGSFTRSYKIKSYGTVPCLSSNIPMEKVKKEIPKRYIEWHEMYTPEFIYDFFQQQKPKSIRRRAVYYKGREIGRREEAWQPKGRVRQDYDEWFDNTDWRDMLKKRIGTLNRENILDKERKGSQLRWSLNDDLFIIA